MPAGPPEEVADYSRQRQEQDFDRAICFIRSSTYHALVVRISLRKILRRNSDVGTSALSMSSDREHGSRINTSAQLHLDRFQLNALGLPVRAPSSLSTAFRSKRADRKSDVGHSLSRHRYHHTRQSHITRRALLWSRSASSFLAPAL